MGKLPIGTVTFLFTDVEGSTKLLHELGDQYGDVLAKHRRVLREAFERHGGVEVDTQGDAFFIAFAKASDAIAAAAEGRDALQTGPIRVRMGLHTGEPLQTDEGYFGVDVHRAARIAAAGHGGQILISQATRELTGSSSLRDLGEHRLKDLTAPERIYQLGEDPFPPLKSLNQTNLPVQPTPLIGRERELDEVRRLLREHRFLTLVGTGGTGKTRLALQLAAEEVDRFEHGVWWIPLAAITDPALVEPTIARTIGATGTVAEHLRSQRSLLLLDNFEQVVDAAPKVSDVLREAPGVTALVTSREPLHVSGEQQYPVPPLADDEAAALFTARAREVKPSFAPDEHLREICSRLDGLPLALELAAARIKILPTAALVGRLGTRLSLLTGGPRDLPERHRTLRATIEWSHELLDQQDKSLFAQIAAFAGSFDLEAVEAVCQADVDQLQSLVDKSLLRQTEEGRFFMLETVREYAAECLEAREDRSLVAERHADHYLSLAEAARQSVLNGDSVGPYARLDLERDNMRSAFRFYEDAAAGEELFRLLQALGGYWFVRGDALEGHARVQSALEQDAAVPAPLRAEVLAYASDFARLTGNADLALSFAEDSLALARETGDPALVSRALHELGESVTDPSRATELFQEAVAAAKAAGQSGAGTIVNLGEVALAQGDYEEAVARSCEALELFTRERSTSVGKSVARFNLSSALLQLDRLDEARPLLKETMHDLRAVGYTEGLAWCMIGAAVVLVSLGSARDAGRLLGAAETIIEEAGVRLGPSERNLYELAVRGIDDATLAESREAGRHMARDEALDLALESLD